MHSWHRLSGLHRPLYKPEPGGTGLCGRPTSLWHLPTVTSTLATASIATALTTEPLTFTRHTTISTELRSEASASLATSPVATTIST